MGYFKKYNNLVGWLVFAVSMVVYVLTTEPTASWWDCMEFTATSYKLEVGHPPGAPLFMILTRLFTMLSFGNTAWVGFTANLMSCLASAFCILFMFWTITRLARKMYGGDGGTQFDPVNKTHVWTVLGAGIIGSLAYAFTDTFWFSAVESEVYALSSMFTALVVWLMLRWEEVADEPHSTRWLILIAYMMGLSIGVHILNLLTIPALVFIYYFRKKPKVTRKGVILALLAAGGILVAIYKMIMPWTVNIGAWVDRVFVNSLGLPVNSGMVAWVLVLFAAVALGVWITHKRGMVLWNTVLLCTAVILIGYSSYASVVIRSAVNPPMNSNRPDNPYALLSLMGREQYGTDSFMLRGPSYNSPVIDYKYSNNWFLGEDGKYQNRRQIANYVYTPDSKTLFPRMFDYASAAGYEDWMGGNVKMRTVQTPGLTESGTAQVPTFGQHLKYFFSFQLNFMYWRYFMWNFVGRQDDIQGRGNILHGNWLSGIGPIDALYLGPQSDLPEELARNTGRNKFFFLPFLLGILGLIAQSSRDKRGFTIVMWLFVMMGVALVVYFNIKPNPPRERDYIYAGSFYAFSIWLGLGVLWIQEIVAKLFKKRECWVSAAIATAVCAIVPTLLLAQGWNDHDRAGRSIGHDLGYNELVSTLPNSIIMNFGDNDTFPLWYNQEVENVRPDVRIMNMSYIGADWYIEQMLHAYNESAPVPLTIPLNVYRANSSVYVEEVTASRYPLKSVLDFVASRDPNTQIEVQDGERYDFIPTRNVSIPVNRENAVASGIVRPEDAHLMVDSIEFTLPKGSIGIDQLVLLDLLSNFDWKRPIFATYPQLFIELGLGDWLQADGWAYRFVPIRTPVSATDWGYGRIDTERTYDLLMNRYKYGNSGKPGVDIDYYSTINLDFVQAFPSFVRLADRFIAEDDAARADGAPVAPADSSRMELPLASGRARAVEVLDRALQEYPLTKFNHKFLSIYSAIDVYYAAGAMERGDVLLEEYANTLQEYIEYYLQFDGRRADLVAGEWTRKFQDLDAICRLAALYGRQEQYKAIDSYLDMFSNDEAEPSPADSLDM
jgi:hypothetical protein